MDNRQPPAQSLLKHLPESVLSAAREPAPVHLWHPAFSGELDMHIARDGTWYYEGGPVTRLALAQLGSGIPRLEGVGRYDLVTAEERWGLGGDDVPLVAVRLAAEGAGEQQRLRFSTSLDQEVVADAARPISVSVDPESGEPSP